MEHTNKEGVASEAIIFAKRAAKTQTQLAGSFDQDFLLFLKEVVTVSHPIGGSWTSLSDTIG
jgi:hypothetical protein